MSESSLMTAVDDTADETAPSARTGDGAEDALEDVLSAIGARIRRHRRDKNMTLQMLADRSGLSVSMLSTVERGRISASVGTLYAIATALDVSLTALFATPPPDEPVVPRERQQVIRTGGGVVRRLALDLPEHRFELYVDTYPPNASHAAVPARHPGHEYGVVLSGALVVGLRRAEHPLRQGDAIQYPTDQEHLITNPHPREAHAVWINTRRV
ncbi:helix-turn-helix domain-containing protein [Streptomyces sp. NPDC090994]|uniref:helix-turn-helix domain-containing protein n=1 Tax=Streptomyces sp. NPDC090994 TaxID=3365969 RepID=UPI0038210AA6